MSGFQIETMRLDQAQLRRVLDDDDPFGLGDRS
jgi:hypothetical protein